LDDVGIGALFGLYDWRFEVMGLIRHTNHLETCYNVGPHTISFPRVKDASSVVLNNGFQVSDNDFAMMIAILRLAVPYTGMILTAREPASVRKEIMKYGVSQIDAGTKIEIGAYAENASRDLDRAQFKITACYRLGRTGEHFMEFSVPGFIKNFCSPNAILTLAEYLEDYATPDTVRKGYAIIEDNIRQLNGNVNAPELRKRLERIKAGERDLYF
jgi:2-iminoacetate synthase